MCTRKSHDFCKLSILFLNKTVSELFFFVIWRICYIPFRILTHFQCDSRERIKEKKILRQKGECATDRVVLVEVIVISCCCFCSTVAALSHPLWQKAHVTHIYTLIHKNSGYIGSNAIDWSSVSRFRGYWEREENDV